MIGGTVLTFVQADDLISVTAVLVIEDEATSMKTESFEIFDVEFLDDVFEFVTKYFGPPVAQ